MFTSMTARVSTNTYCLARTRRLSRWSKTPLDVLSWIYNMQTSERRVASRRVVQIQIVNGLRDATFDGRDTRDATRPNRTKFYLSFESEAVHVASEVAP